jgi:hypothetical protein
MNIEIPAEDHLSSSKQHFVSADHQYAGLGIHSFDLGRRSPSTRSSVLLIVAGRVALEKDDFCLPANITLMHFAARWTFQHLCVQYQT